MPAQKIDTNINVNDAAAQADHDDETPITDEDLGSTVE
jgi:hypothetical protein